MRFHDQVAPDALLLDDGHVFIEPAKVRQVQIEGGKVGETADRLQATGLLKMSLKGEEVGGGARFGDVEEGFEEPAVALEVPVARLQAGADLGDA
ncbi:MAG TPA: hypothetical protein VN493_27555 [Thermoanaerobaculia bacterium]|nr:hypothetical protein [Thermoanaerobaculia bacterium]